MLEISGLLAPLPLWQTALGVAVALAVAGALMGCFGGWRRCRLAGQHVLVTGGSKGIGLAIARGAVARGAAAVTVVARDKAALVEALAELQGVADAAAVQAQRSNRAGARRQPTLQALSADTCNSDAVTRVFAQAEAAAGPIDVLVCNAGLSIPGEDPGWRMNARCTAPPGAPAALEQAALATTDALPCPGPHLTRSICGARHSCV